MTLEQNLVGSCGLRYIPGIRPWGRLEEMEKGTGGNNTWLSFHVAT